MTSFLSFLQQWVGNLRAGAKLLVWRRVGPGEFAVSFDQLIALFATDGALIAGVDWVLAEPEATFDPYGFYVWAYYVLAGLWAAALIARLQNSSANTRALLVTWLAVIPGVIIAFGLILLSPFAEVRPALVIAAMALLLLLVSERAVRHVFGRGRLGTSVLVGMAIVGVPWVFQTQLYLDPRLWVVAEESEETAAADTSDADAESILFDQPERIAEAVDRMAPQRPGAADTYFVGFAGWGGQNVFRNEALLGEQVFAKQFDTGARSLALVNDRDDRESYPLATVSGLRYALQLLGERMDKNQDMLVLLLTSHGSQEEGIAVSNGALPLADLQPQELRSALDDAGIKWRIVIVSACYAGVFLEPLESDSTLVITAADARHNSFGCADDRDLTYFGEAFLQDAMPGARSLEAAFGQARRLIAAREAAEGLTASNPQIFIGSAIRQKLALAPSPIDEAPVPATPDSTFTASIVFSGVSR